MNKLLVRFLGILSVNFALVEPRATGDMDAFVPKLLDAICRDILRKGRDGPAVMSGQLSPLKSFKVL